MFPREISPVPAVLTLFIAVLLSFHPVEPRLAPKACKLPNGRGICVPLDECPPVKDVVDKKQQGPKLSICGIDGSEGKIYVCCRVSAVKCEQYKQQVIELVNKPQSAIVALRPFSFPSEVQTYKNKPQKKKLRINPGASCPGERDKTGLVINGVPANRDEFPHMVAIGLYAKGKGMHFPCGGSLISEEWVLTAAHCFQVNLKFVRIFSEDQADYNQYDPERDIPISRFEIHPGYQEGRESRYHDLALVKLFLKKPLEFSTRVYPACLHQFPYSAFPGAGTPEKRYDVVGWGVTSVLGKKSEKLQKGSLSILDQEKCTESIKKNFQLNRHYPLGAGNGLICALDTVNGSDACNGDSGGPVCDRDRASCVFNLIGVVASGPGCGSRFNPGFYADVYHHLSWIEKLVWPVLDEVIQGIL